MIKPSLRKDKTLELSSEDESIKDIKKSKEKSGTSNILCSSYHNLYLITHLCLASPTMDICKLCRPRSDALECVIGSGTTQFALTTEFLQNIVTLQINLTPLLLEMYYDLSKVLR